MVSGRKRLHHASYFFTPAARLVMTSYRTYICNMNARVCTHKARQTQRASIPGGGKLREKIARPGEREALSLSS